MSVERFPPDFEHCGAPAYNVNGRGDYTGRHMSIEECLRLLHARIAALENPKRSRQSNSLDEALDSGERSDKP